MANEHIVVPLSETNKADFNKNISKRIESLKLEIEILTKVSLASDDILAEYHKSRKVDLIANDELN